MAGVVDPPHRPFRLCEAPHLAVCHNVVRENGVPAGEVREKIAEALLLLRRGLLEPKIAEQDDADRAEISARTGLPPPKPVLPPSHFTQDARWTDPYLHIPGYERSASRPG